MLLWLIYLNHTKGIFITVPIKRDLMFTTLFIMGGGEVRCLWAASRLARLFHAPKQMHNWGLRPVRF